MLDLRWIRSKLGRKVDYHRLNLSYRQIPQDVLADLAEYCGAIHPMPEEGMARAAGRRDVWLHIQHNCHLDAQQVYDLLQGKPIVKQNQE